MRPIIFIHKGASDYLAKVIHMTKIFNPHTRIILLGDDGSKKDAMIAGVDFYHCADYTQTFPYYHVSVNGREYERFCFERWFVLLNFLTKHQIESFIHSDSDNVICRDVSTSEYRNACIGDPKSKHVIVPNVLFGTRSMLKRIMQYYTLLYSQDYPDFIKDIDRYASTVVVDTPNGGKLSTMHYSDMFFLMQAVLELHIDIEVLPESGDQEVIFNGNYRNHSIVLDAGVFINADTKQKLFNVHFQGDSKCEIARFFTELTGM